MKVIFHLLHVYNFMLYVIYRHDAILFYLFYSLLEFIYFVFLFLHIFILVQFCMIY